MRDRMENVAKRIRVGAAMGFAFGVLYTAWIAILLVLNGAEFFESRGISFVGLVVAYLSAGLIGGATVGVLQPLARTWLGAALLGFLVAVPTVHLVSLSDITADPLGADALQVTVGTAALLGPACGIVLWLAAKREARRPDV